MKIRKGLGKKKTHTNKAEHNTVRSPKYLELMGRVLRQRLKNELFQRLGLAGPGPGLRGGPAALGPSGRALLQELQPLPLLPDFLGFATRRLAQIRPSAWREGQGVRPTALDSGESLGVSETPERASYPESLRTGV